jgi:ribosomal-protein-alanine N-acetyltransferase
MTRAAPASGELTDVRLSGERVTLRPWRPSDAPVAFRLLYQREPILRWLVWDGPASVEEIAEHYAHWMRASESGNDVALAIQERASGAFVGSILTRFAGHPDTGDLGYWIGEPYWNRGYASEAIGLAAWLAFVHLQASSLVASVFSGNESSVRALTKNGFARGVGAPTRLVKRGQEVLAADHVLLRSDWEACRGSVRPLEEVVLRVPVERVQSG